MTTPTPRDIELAGPILSDIVSSLDYYRQCARSGKEPSPDHVLPVEILASALNHACTLARAEEREAVLQQVHELDYWIANRIRQGAPDAKPE